MAGSSGETAARGPSDILVLLSSTPTTHPSFLPLLELRPLNQPSRHVQKDVNRLLQRLTSSITSATSQDDGKASLQAMRRLIIDDDEGYTLSGYGKALVAGCLTILGAQKSTSTTKHAAELLETLVSSSSRYPSFERETILPQMGKVAQVLVRNLEDLVRAAEWSTLIVLLRVTRAILIHSPSVFRPSLPVLKPTLLDLCLHRPDTPRVIRSASATLIATLHMCYGKAQAPQGWAAEMKDALSALNGAISAVLCDAWEQDAGQETLPGLPTDPQERLPIALRMLDGSVEIVQSLLSFRSSRPVAVPLARLVTASLRCMNVTYDTPLVSYISPQHHASALAALPKLWTAGALLLASTAQTCGDHLLPHLNAVLDHSLWLLERLPETQSMTQLQMLKLHRLLLDLYPVGIWPPDYAVRLLRICLARISPLLHQKQAMPGLANGHKDSGKRGKKRARGAEDGLLSNLEGRDERPLSSVQLETIKLALSLLPQLQKPSSIPAPLLIFSIRQQLHLLVLLPQLPGSMFATSTAQSELYEVVRKGLEEAALATEGEGGTSRGWKTVLLSFLADGSRLGTVLHPTLPPLHRPMAPLQALHTFGAESDEEKKVREDFETSVALNDIEQQPTSNVPDAEAAAPVSSAVTPAVPMRLSQPAPPSHAVSPTVATATTTSTREEMTMVVPAASTALQPAATDISDHQTQPSPPSQATLVDDFISFSSTSTKALKPVVSGQTVTAKSTNAKESDDEEMPELDSGSSDEEDEMDDE